MSSFKSIALAIAGVGMVVPAAAAAADKDKSQPSVFIQCDGRTGHVSGGERFMRLLLVTATAGISEAAMSGDDDSRRAKGAAGVAACDAAIAKENDQFRRAQLGLAKSLHHAEDQKWAEAEQAARAVPGLIGNSTDWALQRSVATAAASIEAWALVQQGKLAEAEAVQAAAVVRAGTDALALQRTPMYLRLTTGMSDLKRRAYWHLFRFAPQYETQVIHGFADARQYDDARLALANADAVQRAMYKKPPSAAETASLDAIFAAMAGKPAEAVEPLAKARTAFATDRAEGKVSGTQIASIEEQIAFAEAAIAHAEGRDADARRLVSQRGVWAHIAPGMATDLLSRLSASAAEQDKVGPLKDPMVAWNDSVSSKVAAIKEDALRKRHWRSLTELMVDEHYRPMAKQAMSGSSAKPKWLLKPDKEEPLKFDVIAVFQFGGQAVNEPLMLHAALIAKARGKKGFVLFPTRKELTMIGVKFVNPGDEGIGAASIVEADPLISELSPRVNAPVAAGRD